MPYPYEPTKRLSICGQPLSTYDSRPGRGMVEKHDMQGWRKVDRVINALLIAAALLGLAHVA